MGGKKKSVLVGNKCDLETERQLKYPEGKALADQWGCPFFETSAKERINNEACFFEIVREIRRQNSANQPQKPKQKFIRCSIL